MSVPNAGIAAAAEFPEARDARTSNAGLAGLDPADALDDPPPVAPDQFDPKYEATKKEIWSYYAYYIGNNGLTLFNYAPTIFQDLLYIEAGDPGVLNFLGGDKTINSIVLLANGISFAIQVVLFLLLGSLADFGSWRPWILIFWSVVAFGLGFGWLGVGRSDQWQTATGLYMIGLIAYQMCLTFWTAAFPSLARNTPEMRIKAEEFERREISRDEYDFEDMMQRNRIANVAFIIQSATEIVILAIIVGILFGLHVQDSDEANLRGLQVTIAFATAVWVVVAIPWFVWEKHRPGQPIPAGMNYVSVGFWQLGRAFKAIWQLKQSLLYLVGYFLLGDSLNTTVTVVATLQAEAIAFSALLSAYLYIVGIAAQLAGIWLFWTVQKRFKLSTKTMFDAVMLGIILLDAWGMIGIWTQKFGYHNAWEFWLYQVVYGIFVCPWYTYSQIMISEVTPRGKEFLFFSLYSIMGKTSSFIGPIVSSAIIDADTRPDHPGNNSLPFYFLFGLSVLSFLLLFFLVDLKKSRVEQEAFLEKERQLRERRATIVEARRLSVASATGSADGNGHKVEVKEAITGQAGKHGGVL